MKYTSLFIAPLLALTLIGAGCARTPPPAPAAPVPPPAPVPVSAPQPSAQEEAYCTLLSVAEVEEVTGLDIFRAFPAEGGCAFVTVPALGFGAGTEQRALWLGPGPLDLEGAKAAHRSVFGGLSGLPTIEEDVAGVGDRAVFFSPPNQFEWVVGTRGYTFIASYDGEAAAVRAQLIELARLVIASS